jgi:hypothetical protein
VWVHVIGRREKKQSHTQMLKDREMAIEGRGGFARNTKVGEILQEKRIDFCDKGNSQN